MIPQTIAAALAAERRNALLAEAEAHRLVRRARPPVRIRPVRPTDAALLHGIFTRLSPASRYLRFLTPKTRLSTEELRYLTDIDHDDHEALVAIEAASGSGLGVARYVRHRENREQADVAVTVVDDWHGRGLGAELASRLSARAHAAGVRRFTALMASENAGARRLMHKVGGSTSLVDREHGTITYEIALRPPPARRPAWLPRPRPAFGA